MNEITRAPAVRTPPPRTARDIARGLAAVAGLLIGAADALVTAVLGVPRLGWLARRAAAACAEEYRRRGAVDADVISDTQPEHHEENEEQGGGR